MSTFSEITPLEMAQQVSATLNSLRSNSLPEYTAATRLTPIVLLDKRVLAMDNTHLTALMQTLLSLYSGYYLTAVSLTMQIGNTRVMRILDQFSTDRSVLNAAGNSTWLGNEAIDDSKALLPRYGLEAGAFLTRYPLGRNVGDETGDNVLEPMGQLRGVAAKADTDNDKTIHNIIDVSNLAVGKLLDVKLVQGDQAVTIPIHVSLNPKGIDPEDLVEISKFNGTDKSWKARWHQWRSGEIRFIKDFLLVQDLIDDNKKALMADKTGTMLAIRSKRTKGILATLLSGYASPNAISSMVVVTKQTASDMELAIKGSFKNTHVRDQYFSSNSTMLLAVVDTRMERFTLYQRGIASYSEYTFDDIKQNAKKPNGTDIDSLIKAYKAGDAPSL